MTKVMNRHYLWGNNFRCYREFVLHSVLQTMCPVLFVISYSDALVFVVVFTGRISQFVFQIPWRELVPIWFSLP